MVTCMQNHKGYMSMNLQTTGDAEEKNSSIEAAWPGSTPR